MRIALVPYTREWSYDFTAQALVQHLSDRFEFEVFHNDTLERFNPHNFDLVVDFWWRGRFAKRFKQRALVQVSSHRWSREKYGCLSPPALIDMHLRLAGGVLVPSLRLASELASVPHVTVCPKGFHPETFFDRGKRTGSLRVGWAGNVGAPDKRLDILREAWSELRIASGLPYSEMPSFYNSIDVITCASDAEGDPRPLIEGMACGCFPVCVDVGIVPELVIADDSPIDRGEGFVVYSRGIVVERDANAFAAAFAWCKKNLDVVRASGRNNADEMLLARTWKQCSVAWGDAFAAAIERAPEWDINVREERRARILAARKRRAAERARCG